MTEILNTFVSWTANLIQIGAFLFTLVVLWRTRQRLRRLIQLAQNQRGERPVALAIGIGGDISGAVKQYWGAQ